MWKVIKGFEKYSVSDSGEVKNNLTGKILASRFDGFYVSRAFLKNNGERGTKRIHRLVAEAFIDNPENKPQVNHIDGNPQNNQVSNLEWVTPAENIKHAYENGLMSNEKPVLCYDLNWNFISEYKSLMEAAKSTGANVSVICECIKNSRGRTSSGGFRWKSKV